MKEKEKEKNSKSKNKPKANKKTIDMSKVREELREKIYQSNPLIQARKQMGAIELKIFILGLQGVNPHISNKDKHHDEEFWITRIPPSKLTTIFGHTQYLTEIKRACKNIIKTYIEIKEGNSGFTLFNIFYRLGYIPEEGLYLQFHEDLRPYILDIYKVKGYTQYSVGEVFKLSSAYAIRLCELLLQFKGAQKNDIISRTIKIEDLKFALNVEDGKYERIVHFKTRVLDDPIKEINTKTSYVMWYEQIKKGRSITAFTFYMDVSKTNKVDKELKNPKREVISFDEKNAIDSLVKLEFTYNSAKQILAKCDSSRDLLERLSFALKMYEKNKSKVKNKQGYIRKGIEENWVAHQIEEEKIRDEAREIWRQTQINGTSIDEEIKKHSPEVNSKPKENNDIKRMLKDSEIEMIVKAHESGDIKEFEKALAFLGELNWTWSFFKKFYNLNL